MVKIEVKMPDTVRAPISHLLKRKIGKIVKEYVPEATVIVSHL